MKSTIEKENFDFESLDILHFSTNAKRVNNVNVIKTSNGEEIGLCHIPVFNKLVYAPSIKGLLGAYLATKHLNHGNGEVIPHLDGINSTCNMRFTTEFFDTKGLG